MKNIISILVACLAFTILTAGFAAAETITVRADSWAPYNEEPNSEKPGYMIEIARLIFESKGHVIDYQLMPWTRSLDEVKKGNYDAVVGTDHDESPNFIFPEEAFGVNQSGFFIKKGSAWNYTGIDSVKQVRLGIIEGYGYFPELGKYIAEGKAGNKLFAATGDDALPKLLKMLKAGRLDVVIENINVMPNVLEKEKLTNEIVSGGVEDHKTDLFMAFSPVNKKSQEYAKIFDEGLAELRSSGKLQEILSRYGLKDWK